MKQTGFHALRFILLIMFAALCAAALSACASLTEAGHVAYALEPVISADGKVIAYKWTASDGKEFASRTISVINDGNGGVAVQVNEGASSAFQGQAIAEKGLSVLPSFAPILLPPGPAANALVVPAK